MTSILSKMQLSTRVQLAVWMLQQSLVVLEEIELQYKYEEER